MSSWQNRAGPVKRVFKQPPNIQPPTINTVQTNNTPNIYTYNTPKKASTNYSIINGFSHIALPYSDQAFIREVQHILLTKLGHIKKIVCVYKPRYIRYTGIVGGLGDFIRGCLFIYQSCKIAGLDFDINLKYHPIGKYFKNYDHFEEIDTNVLDNIEYSSIINYYPDYVQYSILKRKILESTVKQLLVDLINAPVANGTAYITTHAFPIFEISQDEINFIKSKFEFTEHIKERYDEVCNVFKITPKMYNILHIRAGDDMIFRRDGITKRSKFISKIDTYLKTYKLDIPIILLSDSEEIKEYVSEKYQNVKVLKSIVSHLALEHTHSEQGIIDTLTDFEVICHSLNIVSYTNYAHGSGFAIWPGILNSIPWSCEFIS